MSETRREATTTEMGEPSLIFYRRAHAMADVELLIVKDGQTQIWTIRKDRLPALSHQPLSFFVT